MQFFAEGEGFVYIGLSDGTVQIFLHHCRCRGVFSKEWRRHKTLRVSTNSSLHAMCLVPHQGELLLACGHALVVISTASLLVERRVCLLKNVPPSVRSKVGSLRALVRNEDTVWCCFKSSPLIVELAAATWRVSAVYCVEADLEVFISEVKLGPGLGQEGVCQDCGGTSSFVSARPPLRVEVAVGREGGDERGESSSPAPPPRPPRSKKLQSSVDQLPGVGEDNLDCNGDDIGDDSSVQLHHKTEPTALPPQCGCGGSVVDVDDVKMEELRGLLAMPGTALGSVSDRSRTSSSSSEQSSRNEDVFSGSTEEHPPPLPPPRQRPHSEYPASSKGTLPPGTANLSKDNKSLTLPDLSRPRRPPPPPPKPQPRRPAPPPPPPLVPRRSLPSEHDGVHVQSLLAVKDTLWVGSSCGEVLVIGVQKRPTSSSSTSSSSCSSAGQGNDGEAGPSEAPGFPRSCRARMSLSLEAKQMCNLKSVLMDVDGEVVEAGLRKKSGGVHTLVQARDLVVAVRNVTQAQETQGVAEIAVWEACSAERVSSVRHHWQALHALKDNLE